MSLYDIIIHYSFVIGIAATYSACNQSSVDNSIQASLLQGCHKVVHNLSYKVVTRMSTTVVTRLSTTLVTRLSQGCHKVFPSLDMT